MVLFGEGTLEAVQGMSRWEEGEIGSCSTLLVLGNKAFLKWE